jgi:phosphohistidine phosphatase
MNLFLLRHAIASDPGEDGLPQHLPDTERPLSAEGRQKFARSAKAMRAMELDIDLVFSSPLLRARQTAEIIRAALKLRRKIILTKNLAPDGNPKSLIEQLNDAGPRAENFLLVGHEPYLSRLISLFISGGTAAGIDLKKGGLAKLEAEQLKFARCATLAWLLTPAQLRRLR